MKIGLTFSPIDNRSKGNSMMPALDGFGDATEFPTLDTTAASGVAQLSAAAWEAPEDGFIESIAIDGVAWFRIYADPEDPTPGEGNGTYLGQGHRLVRSIRKGQKYKAAAA